MSSAPATSQVTESMASATPGPTVTTSAAATDGPMIARPARCMDSSTLACWSRPRGTRLGTTLAIAGKLAAASAPLTAVSAMSCHSWTSPRMTKVAMTAWVSPAPMFGHEQHPGPVEPVGDHAAEQQEHHQRDAVGREHPAERRRASR